jgi:hypothetical protein
MLLVAWFGLLKAAVIPARGHNLSHTGMDIHPVSENTFNRKPRFREDPF